MHSVWPIDPHVHLRGTEYPDHEYLQWGLDDAVKVGLCAVLEQPNPVPWLTNFEVIRDRISKVKRMSSMVRHGVHIGLTNDKEEVIQALQMIKGGVLDLASDKIFYTHSTGNMGLLNPEMQRWIWEAKAKMGYKGVSIGHFEDEKVFVGTFDPYSPVSHSKHQNEAAELIQVMTQFKYACEAKFEGTFYVAHVSNPTTIDFLLSEKQMAPFNVVIEATWHHMFLNYDDYPIHGNRVKMNPPLRSAETQRQILDHVLSGHVDIIGTDHAPHPLSRKDDLIKPASGIPGIPFWPKGIEKLKDYGMSKDLLENITFANANRLFNLGIPPIDVEMHYDPSLWEKYGFNPFSRIDKD